MRNGFLIMAIVALTALAVGGWLGHDAWHRPEPAADQVERHPHEHADVERVRLSPQAQANLHLVVKAVQPQTYWRTVQVPGLVIERPGTTDRGVTAPLAGVVKRIAALPGDIVRPGDELFTLGLTSEYLQTSQTELNKTAQELKIVQDQKRRLDKLADTGAIAGVRVIDLQNQIDRLAALRKAQRTDLALRGLTAEQIDQVETGQFVREIVLRAPAPRPDAPEPRYELEHLKVQLGEQVQAGQALCFLSDHQLLFIEGRGFKEDTDLVQRSVVRRWPVTVAFPEETPGDWPPLPQELTIQYLANALDPASQTFPFYIPLPNQHRDYQSAGKTYRLWRFRPGQRVRLGIRVQEFPDVFVVPAAAVVREGPEAYVFRQNGDAFDRKAVHVVYEDSTHAVLAADGSVYPGSYLAQNAAAALNRALKARTAGPHDHHHGHDHEH